MSIHFLSIFLFLLIILLINPHHSNSISYHNTVPKFPCTPPHYNSYTFCNTSLPISIRAKSLISLLTLPEKILQLSNNVSQIPRLGLPAFEWWSESLHGIAPNGPGVSFNGSIPAATSFPQVLVTAASFNRSLWYEIAAAIAVEARAMYNVGQAGLTYWAPNLNVFRDPRWGRGQETPGEDPMVSAAYGVEYVRGFQWGNVKGRNGKSRDLASDEEDEGELMLSACCKHLTAYDLEKWNNFSRYSFNAVVTEQDMQDTYQPPFKSCVEQGKASCVMCSYNAVNGIPACANRDLLQKARNEWGFKGYITSDCDAVATIYAYQEYTKTSEEAVAIALKAGTDINCGTTMLRHTQSAIDKGLVQEEDIDKALLNLFSVQLRLGLYDGNPKEGQFGKLGPSDVCTLDHKKLALEAARQGIVLLKNVKNFLPLKKKSISSLAVVGPLANDTSKMGGGYSGTPCSPKSIVEGLQEYIKSTSYIAGCYDVPCNSTTGFTEALNVSKEAENVVIVVGLDSAQETEDLDRYSLLLPGYQMDLVTTIAAKSKRPVVLVLIGGGPLDVSFAKANPHIASIIWVGYPGEAGGKALAEIIFGDYNPSGRLPMTWYPESFTNVPMNDMNMRADPSRGYPGRTYRFYTGDKIYEFGYGLSYTKYSYNFLSAPKKLNILGNVRVEYKKNILLQNRDGFDYFRTDELESCNSLSFSVGISVMNHGDLDGSHVVMLFSRVPSFFKGAPQKQLIGFDRVDTVSLGYTEASIVVDPCKHLSIVDEVGAKILPLGEHTLVLEDLEHIISIGL